VEESKEKAAKSVCLWEKRERGCEFWKVWVVVCGFLLCSEEEEREGSNKSHALLQALPNWGRWRVQWRDGTFPAWKSDVVKWGPWGRYPVYSACECGGYVIPKVSRVGPIGTRLMGWAQPDRPPRAHPSCLTTPSRYFSLHLHRNKQKYCTL